MSGSARRKAMTNHPPYRALYWAFGDNKFWIGKACSACIDVTEGREWVFEELI